MDLRVYEGLFQFNQGMDQALESLNVRREARARVPRGRQQSPHQSERTHAPTSTTILPPQSRRRSRRKRTNFYRVRRNREKAEEGPNEIYLDLKSREDLRREQGLPPRVVILPWTAGP